MNNIYNQSCSTASYVQDQDSFPDINILNSVPPQMKGLRLVFLRKAFWFYLFHSRTVNSTKWYTTGHNESTHLQPLFMKKVLWIVRMPNSLFQRNWQNQSNQEKKELKSGSCIS